MRPLNPVRKFAVVSIVFVVGMSLALAFGISYLLERHMREVDWLTTADMVKFQVKEHNITPYFTDPRLREQPARYREILGNLLGLPEVVRIKIWDREGMVLWSDEDRLIGKRFLEDPELKRALAGQVAVELTSLHTLEQKYGGKPSTPLAEIYVPIPAKPSGEIVGVVEVYKFPARLFASVQRMRVAVWGLVILGGLLLYVGLLPIVKHSYRKQLVLEGDLRRAGETLRALYRASLQVQEPQELQERLDRLLQTAQTVLDVERVNILLADPAGRWLEAVASIGTEGDVEAIRVPIGPEGGGIARAFRTQQMIVWDGQAPVPEELRLKPPYDRIAAFRSRIFACVSLVVQGQAIGVLGVDRKHNRRPLGSATLELLQLFATQAAVAIQNARLFEDVQRYLAKLQAFYEATKLLSSEHFLDALLKQAVEGAARVVGARYGAVALLDRAGGLRSFLHAGMSPEEARRIGDPPRGLGLLGMLLREGRPLRLDDLTNHPQAHGFPPHHPHMMSCLGVPIVSKGNVRGGLYLTEKIRGPFTAEDEVLLGSFAEIVAGLIEKATLYEELRLAAITLEATVEDRTRELRAANQQLQEASRHKSEFLANMSHELRTPLNSIIGFSELLQGQGPGLLTEKQARYLGHVHQGGKHLLQLISDILDLSKVEAGKFVLQPEPLLVPQTLEDILVIARGLANKKAQEVQAEIAADLPPLHADPVRFKQILFNLLSNAVKFTPDGGRITLRARRVTDDRRPETGSVAGPPSPVEYLEIAVTDTGIGIKPEDMPKLFQEFVQLETTQAQKHEGTGLGLALTKRLVELHGGRIWAASEGEGRGSTFTVLLPFAGPGDATTVGRGSSGPSPTPTEARP